MFVVKKGRMTNEMCSFFELVQEKVLKGKAKNNSILIVTDCETSWIEKEKDTNEGLKRAIKNCNGLYYGFKLKFDDEDDDEDQKEKNIKKRQTSINNFISFLRNKNFNKINLEHVQTDEFDKEWYHQIVPILFQVMKTLLNPKGAFNDYSKMGESTMRKGDFVECTLS